MRGRFGRRVGGVAVAVALAWVLAAARPMAGQEPAAAAEGDHLPAGPMTIAASCVGRFSAGWSWHLSVNSAGQAEVTVWGQPQRFVVAAEDMAALRAVLNRERFFDLANEYGEQVPDGSVQTLTVTIGHRTRSVSVHYLMNWVRSDPQKLREPSRAVRCIMLIRGWIDHPDAVDLRRYDQMVLDAAPK